MFFLIACYRCWEAAVWSASSHRASVATPDSLVRYCLTCSRVFFFWGHKTRIQDCRCSLTSAEERDKITLLSLPAVFLLTQSRRPSLLPRHSAGFCPACYLTRTLKSFSADLLSSLCHWRVFSFPTAEHGICHC